MPLCEARDGGNLAASVAKATTRQATKSQGQDAPVIAENVESSTSIPSGSFDDFDPRNSFTAGDNNTLIAILTMPILFG